MRREIFNAPLRIQAFAAGEAAIGFSLVWKIALVQGGEVRIPFFSRVEKDPGWYANAPREGIERKERSESILRAEKVPINRHLPLIETEGEAAFRTKEEIASRIVALSLVAIKGEGAFTDDQLGKLITRFGAYESFSPVEKAFIDDPNPSDRDRVQFSWRYECLWIMLWALRFVPELSRPEAPCDVPVAVGFLRDLGRDGLIEKGELRTTKELLDKADLIYRYHWAVRESRLQGEEPPANLNPGIVQEWHYALNWLIQEVEWDDVDTST